MFCPKCNYIRTAQDTAPEWQCPACGVAYNKVMKQAAAATPRFTADEPSPGGLRLVSAPMLVLIALVGLGGYWYADHLAKPAGALLVGEAEAKRVEIYTTTDCPYCRQARKYLDEHGIAYTDYNVEQSSESRRKFDEAGGKGVPLLFVNGVRMEGFNVAEFERLYGRS